MAQARATLLLPSARRFGAQVLSPASAKALGRADREEGLGAGGIGLVDVHAATAFQLRPAMARATVVRLTP